MRSFIKRASEAEIPDSSILLSSMCDWMHSIGVTEPLLWPCVCIFRGAMLGYLWIGARNLQAVDVPLLLLFVHAWWTNVG